MALAIHSWHRKPTRLKADRLLKAFTHATKVGCTLDEAMIVAGSYVERCTMSSGYDGYPDTLAGIRRGLKATKQAHNHKVTFANHLPLLRPALAKRWLRPLAKALGIPRAPWQVVVDLLVDLSNDGKANEVRRLFDPEFVHPSPDDVKPDKPLPMQIRAFTGPLPTRSYVIRGETFTHVTLADDTPHVVLKTYASWRSAHNYVERFTFDGTPYDAVAVFKTDATDESKATYQCYNQQLRNESNYNG